MSDKAASTGSMLGWRCPECSDELIAHKDAPCIHTWIASLQAQIHYVEYERDFWKRQYHNRQIEDAKCGPLTSNMMFDYWEEKLKGIKQ